MKEDIKFLIELQKVDSVILELSRKKDSIPPTIEKLEGEIAGIKSALETAKKDFTEKQVERKSFEIELGTIENTLKKHQNELNSIKSNDAYKALLKEIDNDKEKRDEVEDSILKCLEEIDLINERIKNETVKASDAERLNREEVEKLKQEETKLDAAIEDEKKKRAGITKNITPMVVAQYEKICVRRAGLGIVEITDHVCQGCHMKVMHRTIDEVLLNEEVAFCDHCGRILYLDEKKAEEYKKG